MSPGLDLEHLEHLWDGPLGRRHAHYQAIASDSSLALAAALVETGVDLHGLGDRLPSPADLLIGDLCLARASRLLAESASAKLQVGFAAAIEKVAADGRLGVSPREALSQLLLTYRAGT